jgi:hypothetical protein
MEEFPEMNHSKPLNFPNLSTAGQRNRPGDLPVLVVSGMRKTILKKFGRMSDGAEVYSHLEQRTIQ